VGETLRNVLAKIEARDGNSEDPLLVEVYCLLKAYHEELMMRRQDCRGLRSIIEHMSLPSSP
jgi:hypothetical protein